MKDLATTNYVCTGRLISSFLQFCIPDSQLNSSSLSEDLCVQGIYLCVVNVMTPLHR